MAYSKIPIQLFQEPHKAPECPLEEKRHVLLLQKEGSGQVGSRT